MANGVVPSYEHVEMIMLLSEIAQKQD